MHLPDSFVWLMDCFSSHSAPHRYNLAAHSSSAHIRPIKGLSGIVLSTTILVANCSARLLCRVDLGLQRRRIGIDPLKLCEMAVENTDNLAQLRSRISNWPH